MSCGNDTCHLAFTGKIFISTVPSTNSFICGFTGFPESAINMATSHLKVLLVPLTIRYFQRVALSEDSEQAYCRLNGFTYCCYVNVPCKHALHIIFTLVYTYLIMLFMQLSNCKHLFMRVAPIMLSYSLM